MLQLPFNIPKSLVSYAEHFQKEPVKATERLKNQLDKRGPDAVGYFLLSWFYYLREMPEEAIEEALKARIFSPGSPLMQKLHYYLQHPDLFEAWTPDPADSHPADSPSVLKHHGPILDLDTLIQRLSEMDSPRIQADKEQLKKSEKGRKKQTAGDVDDITSETLANIYEKQGKIDTAIHCYKRLKKAKSEKRDYYDEQISRLKILKKQSEEE